jgi:glutamate-1-semialdehyde 2,1-aminomutase
MNYVDSYKGKTPGSAALYERARRVMPGGVCHNPRYFPPYPLYIDKAEGSRIWDVDGNEYVDLWMGHYVHILGHKPEPVYSAIQEALKLGAHWGIVNEHQILLAEELCRILPSAESVRFGVSGTEATMYAIRLARAFTGRDVVLKVRGGWHGGNSDLSVAIHAPMDVAESAGLPPGAREYTQTISFNDTAGTVRTIKKHAGNLAAVIMEAVGQYFVPPEPGYLETVQAETKNAGALFILDEIITGCRLSLRGAQGLYGLMPDLTTMGKVMGGGMNLGMVAGRKDVMDLATPGLPKGKGVLMGGGTFSCMLPSMIAGRTMLRYLEEHQDQVYPALAEKGRYVREGVEAAFAESGIPVRCFGVGSLFTTSFPRSRDVRLADIEDIETKTDIRFRDGEYKIRMLNQGVYTIWGGGAISMAHTQKDLDHIIGAARAVAREMAAERK